MMPDQDRWSRQPKSRGRHAVDAVLFGVAAVALVWIGASRLWVGEVGMKDGGAVRLAEAPVMFWAVLAVHLVAGLVCAWLSYRAVRDGLRRHRGASA